MKGTLLRAGAVLAGCLLLAASGLAHGLWTGRWGASHALEDAVGRLEGVPARVGDWQGREEELPADQIAGARISGYRSFTYENRRKGQAVTVLLVCGRPGPVAVHTPDVCYQGAGYWMEGAPAPVEVALPGGEAAAGLRTATFQREGPVGGGLRIYWGWNAAGRWQAPANPRWSFARYPALYKLYVIREKAPKEPARPQDDPAVEFLKVFLPEVDRALFAAP